MALAMTRASTLLSKTLLSKTLLSKTLLSRTLLSKTLLSATRFSATTSSAILLAATLLLACDTGGGASPAPSAAPGASGRGPSGASASGSASSGATASAPSAAPAPPVAPLSGAWRGRYRAEKASPTLAPTVKEKAWTSDDGRRGSGEGELSLQVSGDGVVSGRMEGPLGPADLVGQARDESLFASIVPRSTGAEAFSGVLEAVKKGDSLEVVVRAADGEAVTVREAKATLSRDGTPPH